MPEHYRRGTESTLAWCRRCGRLTKHRVDDVKLGPCLEHEAQAETQKQKAAREKREREQREPRLFA